MTLVMEAKNIVPLMIRVYLLMFAMKIVLEVLYCSLKVICTKKSYLLTVCLNDNGLCNIYGGVNCTTCGTVCKIGYKGNQCQICQNGFYISNGVTNGNVSSETGEGPICEGTFTILKSNHSYNYTLL